MRRFPAPWTVEKIPGGLKVVDANGQSLAYVYSRENANDAHIANVLTEDEARRIAGPGQQVDIELDYRCASSRIPSLKSKHARTFAPFACYLNGIR
jgi:hypothetical protein